MKNTIKNSAVKYSIIFKSIKIILLKVIEFRGEVRGLV